MRKIFLFLLALLMLGGSQKVFALAATQEIKELYNGPRALSMGGAAVAVANDEEAIFLNPAGLARNDKFRVNYASIGAEISYDIVTLVQESLTAFQSLSLNALGPLQGKNVYMRLSFVPSFIMPWFGLGFLVDNQLELNLRNRVLPQFGFGYQSTNGIQAALGFPLSRRRNQGDTDLRFGFGTKVMWRRGGQYSLPTTTLLTLGQGGFMARTLGNYEMGIGADAGLQYDIPTGKTSSVTLGSAYTEIGDLAFGGKAAPQKGNLSTGIALNWKPGWLLNMIAAYDYKHILDDVDFRKKNHLGLELGFPIIRISGGLNQGYLTYGAAADIWAVKVEALSYGEEVGAYAGQQVSRRYMVNASMTLRL